MEFNFREWNVPLIQEPNELMKKLKELNIKGKKIISIRCVGLCYNLGEDRLEDKAYGYYEEITLEELLNRTSFQAYKNMPLFIRLGFAVGIFEKIPSFQ